MAVLEQNKKNVRPVLDSRELNEHIDACTAHTDVCVQKLSGDKWAPKFWCLIPQKSYRQIRVHQYLRSLGEKDIVLHACGFELNVSQYGCCIIEG